MKVEHKKRKKEKKLQQRTSEWGIFRLHRSRLITESNNA